MIEQEHLLNDQLSRYHLVTLDRSNRLLDLAWGDHAFLEHHRRDGLVELIHLIFYRGEVDCGRVV
jgi:hypothetical protein